MVRNLAKCSGKAIPALLAAASLGVLIIATTSAEARVGVGRPGVGVGRVGLGLGFRPGVGVGRAGLGVRGWRGGLGYGYGRRGYRGYGYRRYGYGAAALTGAALGYAAGNSYGYGDEYPYGYGYTGLYSYSAPRTARLRLHRPLRLLAGDLLRRRLRLPITNSIDPQANVYPSVIHGSPASETRSPKPRHQGRMTTHYISPSQSVAAIRRFSWRQNAAQGSKCWWQCGCSINAIKAEPSLSDSYVMKFSTPRLRSCTAAVDIGSLQVPKSVSRRLLGHEPIAEESQIGSSTRRSRGRDKRWHVVTLERTGIASERGLLRYSSGISRD